MAAATAGQPVDAEHLDAHLVAASDPTQAYARFLPAGPADARRPVLIILDPRGRATDALAFALPAARERRWIVLSAWGSRSDTDESGTLHALHALLQEADRLPHDPRRVYLAGMSGTAKTLWVAVQRVPGRFAGLIASAGGRPPELPPLRAGAPPVYGTAGTRDFNYREMQALDDALATAAVPHRLDVFEGPHGWPPTGLGPGIAWHELQAMRAGLVPRDAAWIAAQSRACDMDIAAAPDALERRRRTDACARDFDGLRDTAAWSGGQIDEREVERLRRQDQRLEADERRYARRFEAWRERFGRRFVEGVEQPPLALPESLRALQIATLRRHAADADPRVAASARRLLAWVHAAAAAYLPAQFEAQGDHARALALRPIADATTPPEP